MTDKPAWSARRPLWIGWLTMLALIGALDQGGTLSNLMGVVLKNLTLRGFTSGTREMLVQLLQTVAMHRIEPVVDRVFDFDEALAAYAHLQSGRHVGKVLVRVAG